ncbi:RNA-binding cell elongation regulator Jag/EloR [Thalassobacillus pellis]|uniref:RNA-binding cell elongation regulator Jag/EloR n=1 Tax=Thalassobacillus pellis TaxID=748008 RepID=UPI0019606FE1|nr:spoIIIJ-associated protein [Thalassobacillus pellis]
MKQITATGQTVEDAVQSALEQLQTSRDQVEVEIIDEGKKGFFGFGSKPSIVKVLRVDAVVKEPAEAEYTEDNQSVEVPVETVEKETVAEKAGDPDDFIENAEQYLASIAEQMGAPAEVKTTVSGRDIHFELVGEKIAMLIGKRGQTLNALQYLMHLAVNRQTNNYYTVVVDAEGYRSRRKDTLETLAGRLSEKALRTNEDVKLEPMPSYERKIIHTALQNHNQVETYSAGNEPKRYVVIRPVK